MSVTPVLLLIFLVNLFIDINCALPDPGKYDFELSKEKNYRFFLGKSLYKDSQIFIQITCEPKNANDVEPNITITWNVIRSVCWDFEENLRAGEQLMDKPMSRDYIVSDNKTFNYVKARQTAKCQGHIILDQIPNGLEHIEENAVAPVNPDKKGVDSVKRKKNHPKADVEHPVWTVPRDGVYVLILQILSDSVDFNASVHIEMMGTYGYLSAADWPLLPFYGSMCLVYVFFGIIWLLVSFLQWRDLLRIQFWIGGVILLGMLEKATFYAEYQSINATGVNVNGAMLLAEWVSCGKRTLARMLVIIVSLGFGIVKPRLGPMLHRVVGAGVLYFVLAAIESYLRVMHKQNDRSREILIASIPLAILDSAICWWIFTSLVQTTRTLRLRRNMVKLSLYKHFTNTLIFSVIASVIFMIYSIRAHKLALCITDWKELWVDEAYWHILFSVILLVIMILWRPTNNNQRYAFTPLLDNPEDDDDDEEDQFVSDAYGVKVRFHNRSASPKPKSTTNIEDDIRWVEENIPASMGDATLPILDSDEEIMNTKFEVSKMQ